MTRYLIFSALLFSIGMLGLVLNRKNLLSLLMSLELLLLAVSTNFIVFSRIQGTLDGQIMVLFILSLAACEAVIGLSLLMLLFKKKQTTDTRYLNQLRG